MTDAFTTAARAEAERRNPPIDRYPDDFTYPRAVLREHKRGEFEAAAVWARDHLAAQEPTDAEKEAAMDALGCELRVVENGQATCDLHGGYATADDVCELVAITLTAAKEARHG